MFAILYLKELLLKINFYIKTNYLFLKLIFLFLNIFQLKNSNIVILKMLQSIIIVSEFFLEIIHLFTTMD
ncbi:hypothetical protein B9T23_05120 [Acinetobacter terrae]|nr:hypothetical protein B9T23_05120 [Acinetobacter terrae]